MAKVANVVLCKKKNLRLGSNVHHLNQCNKLLYFICLQNFTPDARKEVCRFHFEVQLALRTVKVNRYSRQFVVCISLAIHR